MSATPDQMDVVHLRLASSVEVSWLLRIQVPFIARYYFEKTLLVYTFDFFIENNLRQ